MATRMKPRPSSTKRTRTALDAKRAPTAYDVDPESLYIELDPKSPRYDKRVELPVTDEHLAAYRITGQTKDVLAFKNGDRTEVIDGRQTVRVAIAINAERVRQALPKGTVRVQLRKVKDDSQFVMLREISNLRHTDPPSVKAEKAMTFLEVLKLPRDMVMLALGVKSETGLKQYLDLMDLIPQVRAAVDAGTLGIKEALRTFKAVRREDQAAVLAELVGKKAAPASDGDNGNGDEAATKLKSGRPSITVVKRVYGHKFETDPLSSRERALLGWQTGDVTVEQLLAEVPELAPALGA
jgi:hypothetical protein